MIAGGAGIPVSSTRGLVRDPRCCRQRRPGAPGQRAGASAGQLGPEAFRRECSPLQLVRSGKRWPFATAACARRSGRIAAASTVTSHEPRRIACWGRAPSSGIDRAQAPISGLSRTPRCLFELCAHTDRTDAHRRLTQDRAQSEPATSDGRWAARRTSNPSSSSALLRTLSAQGTPSAEPAGDPEQRSTQPPWYERKDGLHLPRRCVGPS